MPLPKDFQFSQGSLQDFVECRRRFYLRYILKLRWPAVQTEPILQSEHLMLQGAAFHQKIHQYLLGIPVQPPQTEQAENDTLAHWWQNFLTYATPLPGVGVKAVHRFPEHTLAGTVDGSRLVAKYDLISVLDDRRIILYDWKTSQNKPRRSWLTARMQTVVYPYLLVIAGQHLAQPQNFQPHQISMVYWFAAFPEQAETFTYNQQEFEKARQQIADMTSLINRLAQNNDDLHFPLTEDEKRCAYCVYRSLCNRGVRAGLAGETFEQDAQMDDIEFSFDQISEIVF